MGLSKEDKKPEGISLIDAYNAIKKWYQANIAQIQRREGDYLKKSVLLIKNLPEASKMSEFEFRAVFGEIIYGNLEWAYHQSDGKYKMAAYAHAALEAKSLKWSLSEEERNKLRDSKLWPFLNIGR